jgi:hypothetical protein
VVAATQLQADAVGGLTQPASSTAQPTSPRRADQRQRGDARPVDDVARALERTIDALLDQRRAGTTICPSEAARGPVRIRRPR